LSRLVANDAYPKDQLKALRTNFAGDTLVLRGDGAVRADLTDVRVRWRAPVKRRLESLR
jgi:hypothetical protein